MKLIEESLIPKRIKKMRLERLMTQEKLAEAIGVSKGYISRIENSDTAPPVGILIALSQTFNVTADSFFKAEEPEIYVTVTRKESRPVIARDHMVAARYEHLALNFPKRAFEPYIMKVPPGMGKSRIHQHAGQELLYVLKGCIEMNINNQIYRLETGDTMLFDSTYPHFGRCTDGETAELCCFIFQKPDFSGQHPAKQVIVKPLTEKS